MALPNGDWTTQRTRCQSLGGDLAVYNRWVAALLSRGTVPAGLAAAGLAAAAAMTG
jgi:hypothetical protein